MRKASRQRRKSSKLMMKTRRRYLAECEAEWKWAATARTNMARVKKAATGWIIRMAERVVRAEEGRSKVAESAGVKI